MIENLISQTNLPPGFIDLGVGNPDLALLPLELLHHAAEKYFSGGDPLSLQYGLEQGNGYFRAALADFLSTDFGSLIEPNLLFTTTGASSALDLLCTLYTRPGEVIFVEEPSYFLALRIFADHGLQVISIPMDDGGLNVDVLGEMLEKHQPKFIYVIPTFQNPSGRTLSLTRRKKMIQLAQRHNFLIIADEVYHLLSYTQIPPQPFATFSKNIEQVISINSFSKILAPGLRLGWIYAHDKVIKQLVGCGLLDSGGGMNPFTSAIVSVLIETGGLAENITNLRKTYVGRLNALVAALDQHIPTAEYTVPYGGFFFWVRLPGKDISDLRHSAKSFDVDFRQGKLFSSQKGMQDYFRLSFSFYNPINIKEGVKRLGNCLQYYNND